MLRRMKGLVFRARWHALAVAIAALVLSGVATGPHGDGHTGAAEKPLAAHEHHDGGTAPDHGACDLAPTCGAKVFARGSGALTVYQNPRLSVLQIGEHSIPNGHTSRPEQPPPRRLG